MNEPGPLSEFSIDELVAELKRRANGGAICMTGLPVEDLAWQSHTWGSIPTTIGLLEAAAFDLKMQAFNDAQHRNNG